MLSHKNRFHGHGSLRYLYQNGKKIRTKELGVHFLKNPKRVHSRFAVVVSKKVYKSAVKRNTTRRRIYEILRYEIENIKEPYDIIVTVFAPEILELPHKDLKKLLRNLLVKEKIIS